MLSELFIDNFVIIKRQHIFFEKGFNVLTGETGSGKSLILDSINLLLGKRADKDAIGRFSDKATIEGVFDLEDSIKEKLTLKGIIFDDNKLIITRIISKNSSVIRINSRISNLSLLKEISPMIIDVYNQGDSSNFMNKKNYLNIIDSYSKDIDTKNIRIELKKLTDEKKDLLARFESLDMTEEQVQREKELINYQIEDIEEINLENINEEEIDNEYRKLNNITDLKESIEFACELISSMDYDKVTISNILSKLSYELNKFSEYDEMTSQFSQKISLISEEVDSLYSDIEYYKESLDEDPERLYQLEMVTQKLFDLKRKYGNSIEDIVRYYKSIKEKLKELEEIIDLRNNISKKIRDLDNLLLKNSEKLHNIRLEKSNILEEKIKKEIQSLNILNGEFKIRIKKNSAINEYGFDDIDFLIKTNKGEELKSLSKTASGGEISRIMLSFKGVFADFDDVSTMIFDEIDQGISGRTAQIVAEKILELSKKRQIIAISHLPQIATLSNNHILIRKTDNKDYTISEAETIDSDKRIDEIARLIGGVNITDITFKSAKEMLEMAEELRNGK